MKPPAKATGEFRTLAQACAQLGCSKATVWRLWKKGKLEKVKFNGQARITARSLDALVNEILTHHVMRP